MDQPGMSERARMFLVPLVVLSVVLVALIVAIVVAVVVRAGDRSDQPGSAGATTAAGEIDPCVVGGWRVTAHREGVTIDGVGEVTFDAKGTGPSVRLNADGTGVTDYGTGTRYEGVAAGRTIRLDVRGTVTYRYAAADGTFSFRDMASDAKATIFLDGARSTETRFTGSTDPASYECAGDRMVERTGAFQTTFSRVAQ
jgi:hypothetical protein